MGIHLLSLQHLQNGSLVNLHELLGCWLAVCAPLVLPEYASAIFSFILLLSGLPMPVCLRSAISCQSKICYMGKGVFVDTITALFSNRAAI